MAEPLQERDGAVVVADDVEAGPFEGRRRRDQLVVQARLGERLRRAELRVQHVVDVLDRRGYDARAAGGADYEAGGGD